MLSNDILKYKKIYDETYSAIGNYNFYDEVKNAYVDTFAAFIDGNILDAGCGEGIHFKRLLKKGYDVFGIELSEVCCDKYLMGFPHQNTDIVSFAAQGRQFAGIICMDVLEHIPSDTIDETIRALSKMSSSVFLGIANHSDVLNGVQLHLIQEDSTWWVNLLKNFYEDVVLIEELYEGMFFFIQCDNAKKSNQKYLARVYDVLKVMNTLQEEKTKEQKENVRLVQENVILMQHKAELEQEKIKLEQVKVVLEQDKAGLELENLNLIRHKEELEQEIIELNKRYKLFEMFRRFVVNRK